MKKIDLSRIQDLAIDEVADVITPEEKEYLYWAISVDPDAKNIWQDIQNKAPQLLAEAEESMRTSGGAKAIIAAVERKRQNRFSMKALFNKVYQFFYQRSSESK